MNIPAEKLRKSKGNTIKLMNAQRGTTWIVAADEQLIHIMRYRQCLCHVAVEKEGEVEEIVNIAIEMKAITRYRSIDHT